MDLSEKRKELVNAMVPLEVLYWSMRNKPYKELSPPFSENLLESIEILRNFVFNNEFWRGKSHET